MTKPKTLAEAIRDVQRAAEAATDTYLGLDEEHRRLRDREMQAHIDQSMTAIDEADRIEEHRAWIRSDAYWLRLFVASALHSGRTAEQAVVAAADALELVREKESPP